MADSFEITDKVKRALKTVIEKCVQQAEPTSRHSLRTELDGPTLHALIQFRYLRTVPTDQYWPGIIAFEDCGEKWLLDVGRSSLGFLLQAVHQLYKHGKGKWDFKIDEVWQRMQEIAPLIDSDKLRVALALLHDVDIATPLTTSNGTTTTITGIASREELLDFKSIDDFWTGEVRKRREEIRRAHESAVSESELSRQFDFVSNSQLRSIVIRDYAEMGLIASTAAIKSRIILAGGLIEGLLLDVLSRKKKRVLSSQTALKVGKKSIEQWGLAGLIDVSVELKIISPQVEKLGGVVREYRNLVHPGLEKRSGLEIGSDEATIAQSVLSIVIKDLRKTKTVKRQAV